MSDKSEDLFDPDHPAVMWAKRETWYPYFEALGEFVHNFSALENNVASLLRLKLGITQAQSGAVLSGFRIDACISAIKRLDMSVGGEKERDRLKPMWDQVGVITGVRNSILHFGAYDRERNGEFSIVKLRQAYLPDQIQPFPISVTDLKWMTTDVQRMLSIIWFEAVGNREKTAEKLAQPWLYKPPQPERIRPASRTTKPTSRRPQKPSAE